MEKDIYELYAKRDALFYFSYLLKEAEKSDENEFIFPFYFDFTKEEKYVSTFLIELDKLSKKSECFLQRNIITNNNENYIESKILLKK